MSGAQSLIAKYLQTQNKDPSGANISSVISSLATNPDLVPGLRAAEPISSYGDPGVAGPPTAPRNPVTAVTRPSLPTPPIPPSAPSPLTTALDKAVAPSAPQAPANNTQSTPQITRPTAGVPSDVGPPTNVPSPNTAQSIPNMITNVLRSFTGEPSVADTPAPTAPTAPPRVPAPTDRVPDDAMMPNNMPPARPAPIDASTLMMPSQRLGGIATSPMLAPILDYLGTLPGYQGTIDAIKANMPQGTHGAANFVAPFALGMSGGGIRGPNATMTKAADVAGKATTEAPTVARAARQRAAKNEAPNAPLNAKQPPAQTSPALGPQDMLNSTANTTITPPNMRGAAPTKQAAPTEQPAAPPTPRRGAKSTPPPPTQPAGPSLLDRFVSMIRGDGQPIAEAPVPVDTVSVGTQAPASAPTGGPRVQPAPHGPSQPPTPPNPNRAPARAPQPPPEPTPAPSTLNPPNPYNIPPDAVREAVPVTQPAPNSAQMGTQFTQPGGIPTMNVTPQTIGGLPTAEGIPSPNLAVAPRPAVSLQDLVDLVAPTRNLVAPEEVAVNAARTRSRPATSENRGARKDKTMSQVALEKSRASSR